MGTGRKKGPGGGGASLNFKVVGNPQPANPKENTIWLNTDVDITGQYLQAEQPEGMAEGEVWISTGTESQVAFNALKKGTIMVYPLAAKQMQGGTLVDVTAKSWQDGAWVDWLKLLYIFREGDGVATGYTVKGIYPQYGFLVRTDKITISTDVQWGDTLWVEPMIDLTPYNYLYVELACTGQASADSKIAIGVGDNAPGGYYEPGALNAGVTDIYSTKRAIYRVSIQNMDKKQYIIINSVAVTGYIYNIWLSE